MNIADRTDRAEKGDRVGGLDRMGVDRNVRKEDMREREEVKRVHEKDRQTDDRLVDREVSEIDRDIDRKDRSGMANRKLDEWRRHDVDDSGTWSPEGRQVGALQ
jgi:hypothetical protein